MIRKRKPGGGRKPSKVKKVHLSCRVLPETKLAIGKNPGAQLDKDYSNPQNL